jgi:hypothetical protein
LCIRCVKSLRATILRSAKHRAVDKESRNESIQVPQNFGA